MLEIDKYKGLINHEMKSLEDNMKHQEISITHIRRYYETIISKQEQLINVLQTKLERYQAKFGTAWEVNND